MTITKNYINGVGITRSWSTSGIFAQGFLNVVISNNEVTRTAGNAIFIKGQSLGKSSLAEGDFNVHAEYNYVHDFGMGITSDFGGIKTGSTASNCDGQSYDGLEQNCYTHIKLYNNLVR